ncbi:MAG: DUF4350 domain-containing protein [Bacteroidetes bacterium]|nr:DUF4350 domain-containing protein [Bacteroidota bacterium]
MKKNSTQIYLLAGIGVVLLIAFIYGIASQSGKQFSWKESFSSENKQPYGTYVLYDLLPEIFEADSITNIETELFDQLVYEKYNQANYIFINSYFPADKGDIDEMLRFVREGNYIFISARRFSSDFEDKLGFEAQSVLIEEKDSITISLKLPDFSEASFTYPIRRMNTFFEVWDSRRSELLATSEDGKAKLLQIKVGKGGILLSADPIAMTNYFMVHPKNHGYVAGMLSYLPKNNQIFWDEYYKTGTFRRNSNPNTQPEGAFSYLMRQESLRWGFWVIILALILYAAFEAKRTQRTIPIIKPHPNTTLDFTETVGRLYFQQNDHKNVASKKIKFFLAYIREHYFLKTHEFTTEFLETLAGKSGIPLPEIQNIFRLIDWIGKTEKISEEQLIQLNHYIDKFYQEGAR